MWLSEMTSHIWRRLLKICFTCKHHYFVVPLKAARDLSSQGFFHSRFILISHVPVTCTKIRWWHLCCLDLGPVDLVDMRIQEAWNGLQTVLWHYLIELFQDLIGKENLVGMSTLRLPHCLNIYAIYVTLVVLFGNSQISIYIFHFGCPKCANGTSNFTFVASLLAQYFKMSTYCQSVQTAVYQLLLAFS